MKKLKKFNRIALTFIALGSFLLLAFTLPQEQKMPEEWDIPEEYQTMENPYKDDKSLERIGKMLYAKHCRSCHGNKGQCDGPKAKQMETWCGDFTTEEFQNQADGVIYYKSIIGRDEMPNYESKIPDVEDRWAIVNYIRTLDD